MFTPELQASFLQSVKQGKKILNEDSAKWHFLNPFLKAAKISQKRKHVVEILGLY